MAKTVARHLPLVDLPFPHSPSCPKGRSIAERHAHCSHDRTPRSGAMHACLLELPHRGLSAITSPLSRLTKSCLPCSLTSLHEAAAFFICEQTRLSSARHGPELA